MPNKARRPICGVVSGAIFAASSGMAAWAAGTPPITTLKPGILQICLYAGFAPFAFKENGDWKGWDVDYLRAFAGANNLAIELVEEPRFEGIWLRPGEGQCDIAGSGISDTEERRTAVNSGSCWSKSYYGVLRSFLVRSSQATMLAKVEDLRGRTAVATKDSTAHLDLCNRMQLASMKICAKPDGDHPCANLDEVPKKTDPACVLIEYPRDDNETNAATDLLNATSPDAPFAYGGGYGSIQTLVHQAPSLALVWPHCNMVMHEGRLEPYAEPFSFVVSSQDTGLLRALNEFIEGKKTPYAGSAIPDLSCKAPPWTLAPPPNPACQQ